MTRPLPYILEDRSGSNTDTDFDDMYDRLFFRVLRKPQETVTNIYQMNIRASRHRSTLPFTTKPSVVLEFGKNEALGDVSFVDAVQWQQPVVKMQMGKYLKKTSLFGTSLSRKFVASDGKEYKWAYNSTEGQQWTCTSPEDVVVAHYNLKPPDLVVYDFSGNNLTIYEAYVHLAMELLASLIIMRHIAQHNL